MRHISPLDLRRSLGSILDAASAGERFLIERDHRPLAMLVSVEDGARLDESKEEQKRRRLAAMARIDARRELRARLYPSPPGTPDAVELIRQLRSKDDPDGYPEYPEDEHG
jgi:antitoxin (DNA-binding transcriptional repressor) of toxin-antitoxin stability system